MSKREKITDLYHEAGVQGLRHVARRKCANRVGMGRVSGKYVPVEQEEEEEEGGGRKQRGEEA